MVADSQSISLKTKIAYPRQVTPGATYLVTIDLDHDISAANWPYPEEEYPVTCLVDSAPFFDQRAEGDATVIVSRFGGSYGPARFWLTARNPPDAVAAGERAMAAIDVLMINASGVPIHHVQLEDIELRDNRAPASPPPEPVTEIGEVPHVRRKAASRPPAKERTFRWLQVGELQFLLDAGVRRPDVAAIARGWSLANKKPIDAVILAGDITSGARPEEFAMARVFVRELLQALADAQGEYPRLIVVPGNHDCTRIRELEFPSLQDWTSNSPLRSRFWAASEELEYCARAFGNFETWLESMEIPSPRLMGLLPGDRARTIDADGMSVGVLGLNDSILKPMWIDTIADLHPSQLHRACGRLDRWAERHDLRLLVTHHGPGFLPLGLRDSFYKDFAPRSLFDIHIHASWHDGSPTLTTLTSDGRRSASVCASQLNGAKSQGFHIGEATLHGTETSVTLFPFREIGESYRFIPLDPVTQKIGSRPKKQRLPDGVEDNVMRIHPASVLSTRTPEKWRAIMVGLHKVGGKSSPTARMAFNDLFNSLSYDDVTGFASAAGKAQVLRVARLMLVKSKPEDLLVYVHAAHNRTARKEKGRPSTAAPNGWQQLTSDDLLGLASKVGRRMLILGDITAPTEIPAGCGVIRCLGLGLEMQNDELGFSGVVNALGAAAQASASVGELMQLINEHQTFNRSLQRIWIRADLTEELARLQIGPRKRGKSRPGNWHGGLLAYSQDFLGFPVPAPNIVFGVNKPPLSLDYLNFTVVFNPERKMAWYSAANVDYRDRLKDDNEIDWERWRTEKRVPPHQQLSEEVFNRSGFDHARLVKRMMPAWGDPKLAGDAFGDTGHYTNLIPLMSEVNQDPIWRALPDHILKHHAHGQRMSFFSGPLFSENDPEFRGVKIPAVCWMVMVYTDHTGRPQSVAFLTSQLDVQSTRENQTPEFIGGLPTTPLVTRVPLHLLLQVGGLDFGVLHDFDVSQNDYPFRQKNALPGTPITSLKTAIPHVAPHGNITRPANQVTRPKAVKRAKAVKRPKKAKARAKRK